MSKIVLVAAPIKAAQEGKLKFLSTQSVAEFKKDYCDEGTGITIVSNPHGDGTKHPSNLFITWKQNGQTFNGSVSHKIVTKEDISTGVNMISIAEDPDPESTSKYVVILHKEAERNNDNVFANV